MWVDAAASHAGAQAPVAVNLIAQWAHIVAAGVWIGGLLTLVLAVRGQPSETKGRAVRRFSTTAGIAIVVVALTGTFRAVIEVGSIGQLFSTAFGLLVVVKVALFVGLAVSPGTAGFNTFDLRVTDYDTGAPVHATSVQLEFTQPLRPQLGQSI